ncbi:MAG TPA: ATP-binding protein [Flavipsychrobacter sp.]|nr:ATP-binding protein [Flavipsychrobacter sp.]
MKQVFRIIIIFMVLQPAVSAQEKHMLGTHSFSYDTAAIAKLIDDTRKLRHYSVDTAIGNLKQAYEMSVQSGYSRGILRSLTNMGLLYMDKGNYDTSLKLYFKAMPYALQSRKQDAKPSVVLFNNIAAVYGNRNIYDTAAMYYYKALETFEYYALKDTNLLLSIYSNLGGRLAMQHRPNQARFYLDKAIPIAIKAKNDAMLGKLFMVYSGSYGVEKNYTYSRIYSTKALQIFDTIRDPGAQIAAYCNLAETYLMDGDAKKAIFYYRQAFSRNKQEAITRFGAPYRGLGEAYLKLKDYPKAAENYLAALKISELLKSTTGLEESYKALVEIYTAQKDYAKALEYRNKYGEIIDSNLNAERLATFSTLDVKYRMAQKDKELAESQLQLTQKSNELQLKNILLITVSVCAVFVVILIINIYRSRKQKETLQLKALKSKREITQLRATMTGEEKERLRIARELHDGIMIQFSSVKMNLSAFNEQYSGSENPKLNAIIGGLDEAIKELRKSAHNLMPDMLLKEGLTEAVHYFCVKLQESSKMEIDFQAYGTLPCIAPEYELMLYRMVQELLQNIVKHAHATHALIQLNYQPDIVSITVEDNGEGFDEHNISTKTGLGLAQIQERIHSLNGHLHFSHSKPQGTSVYLELETKNLQQLNANAYNSLTG